MMDRLPRRLPCLVSCLASLLLATAAHAAADALKAPSCAKVVIGAGPDYPPLHWYDGSTLHGASLALATRIFADMGVPYEVRYVGPFPRLMANVQAGHIDVVTTLKQTPERSAYMTFTTVPAFANPVSVFVQRRRAFAYSGWQDLQGRTGGIAIGTRFGEPFDSYLRDHLRVENSSSLESNFKKLAIGRIDYLITGYYNGIAYLEGRQLQQQFVALTPPVNESQNYIGFYRNSACMRYFKEFDRRLAVLAKAGEPDKMVHAALDQWRAAPHTVR
jgi:polar amino acid transport system substrate-binding protein